MFKIKNRPQVILIIFMQIGLFGALLWSLFHSEWLTAFVSLLALLIVWLPPILAKNWKVHFPIEFELLLNIFIYASIFLGEFRGFYSRLWWWDVILHFSSGLSLGFLGFLIVYSLYRNGNLKTSPFLLSFFAFCFALSLGALWEIFEFFMDKLFDTNMQKAMLNDPSGLTDTMWDLTVDAAGAFILATSAYFYLKYRKSGLGIFKYFLKVYFPDELEKNLK